MQATIHAIGKSQNAVLLARLTHSTLRAFTLKFGQPTYSHMPVPDTLSESFTKLRGDRGSVGLAVLCLVPHRF